MAVVTTQPASVPMTASLAGRYAGASRAWKVWGPMMLPIEKEPLTMAAANARLVEPATLAAVHCIRLFVSGSAHAECAMDVGTCF